MEMWFRLRSMMLIKRFFYFALFGVMLSIIGCTNEQTPMTASSGINGIIQTGSLWHPNGVKVTIENVTDKSAQYIAVSDEKGNFYFRDIEPGAYIIDAEKEGYEMDYIILDNKTILGTYQQKMVELMENETKNVTISMSPTDVSSIGTLSLTDMKGNPLNKIVIPKDATTISLRLFNGTQSRCFWKIRYDSCFGSIGLDVVYLFSAFSVSEGVLESGDNVVLVGYINSEIFSQDFSLLSGYLYLYDNSIVSHEYSVLIAN